ncbi:hypothetical protein U6A24_08060 [Aquimarina gracilis]|uniref:Uncharacterized protein n=1 Tax=Aquimarina gracilis TaxID=874422 RepID=A0ABU5ZV23_9FLAO|nr:hypothetical protein [Aquimarina gracilis]MEB3345407.1 hypothetical protein [Aquimarina gracilis]
MAELENNIISVIQQNDPDIPEYLDFEKLRREGLEHIGNLSGKIWTDHNVHDPGVTILEVLVYALMDLGYRTNLPFQDLIALKNNNDPEDNFLTPLEILTVNPVTITDYRKLLLEVEGVRNAWLEPASEQEIGLYLDTYRKTLVCKGDSYEGENAVTRNEKLNGYDICLNGLYKVYIEKNADIVDTVTLEQDVINILAKHRNLCEDFVDGIKVLDPVEIGVCVEAELHAEFNAEKVYAEIFNRIRNYIQPEIKYYTLEELLDKGKTIDDIFAGRPYRTESYGFVDTEEIENFNRRESIYLSDLYDVILSIDGVRKIKNIAIKEDSVVYPGSGGWEYIIPDGNVPVFSSDKTCIDLYNVQGVLKVNKSRIEGTLYDPRKFLLSINDLDTQVPLGSYRDDLEEYYSIQNDFPVVYGIGEDGLPDIATGLRKTQAKQLKGYLMFYDQILANYTSQLANIRSLFSLKPEDERTKEEKSTYFTQIPDSVPRLEELLRFYKQDDVLTQGSILAVPVANNAQWTKTLEKLQNNPNIELTIQNFCNDQPGIVNAFNFSSSGLRAVYINQLINSFSNENFTIKIIKDKRGYFFVIDADVSDDVLLVGTTRSDTPNDARKEAKNLAFLAMMHQSYNEVTNTSDTNEPDEHYFNITYSPLSYIDLIQELTEDTDEYLERRKQFLDHLLARFGEEFSDYVVLQFQNRVNAEEFKEDEIKSQSEYVNKFPEISRDRGKAFNYLDPSWNTDNVSGFEKRIALLSGIGNYQRRNLCNFEVTQNFRIILKDWSGNTLFRSNRGYDTIEELREASRKILGQLRDDKSYKHLEKSLNGFDSHVLQRIFSEKASNENIIITRYHYYQQLKNVDGKIVVTSKNQKMRSEKVGNDKKSDFIKTINEQELGSDIHKREKYRLLPLGSDNRYLDINAFNCHIETLVSWKWHVNDIRTKEKTECVPVFKTDDEAWDNMVREANLESFLTQHDIALRWNLRINKNVSVKGLGCYPDSNKSIAAWRQAKMLGSSLKNFSVEKRGEYSVVCLKNEKGKVIAQSNEFSTKENDERIVLETCVSIFGDRKTQPEYNEERKKYGFQILGKDNTPMFMSYCVYDSPKEALQQMQIAFKQGVSKNNYLLSGDQGNPEYNFILKDASTSFLALPPDHFETAADRTKALNAMMRYFKSNELPVFVKEEPRRYIWSLMHNESKILNSETEFTSKARASANFDKTIVQTVLAKNDELYKPHCYDFEVISTPAQYKFIYGDSDAQDKLAPIFISTDGFSTPQEASKGYTDFIQKLPGLLFKVSPKNDTDFGLYTSGSSKAIVGAYSKSKPSLTKAQNIVGYVKSIYSNDLKPKASFIDRQMIENQEGRYEWRFYKKNAPLAVSPYRCEAESLAEDIKKIICDTIPPIDLKQCPKKAIVVCPKNDPNKFHYQIEFKDCDGNQFVLISYLGYNSFEEAEEAWQNEWIDVIEIATNADEYLLSGKINIEETYDNPNVKSCDQASYIAVIPKVIREALEQRGKDVILHYTGLADQFPIYKMTYETLGETQSHYGFKVVVPQSDLISGCKENSNINHQGSLLWVSQNTYSNAQETINAYQYFYNLAGASNNCKVFCDKEGFYVGLVEVLAESSQDFASIPEVWDDGYPRDKDDCKNCTPGGVREFLYAAEDDKNYIPICEGHQWKFKVVSPSYFVSEHNCYYNSAKKRDEQMESWLTKLKNINWDQYIIWQVGEGSVPRKEIQFLSRIGYGYSTEEFCKLVFAFRDSMQKCTVLDESAQIDIIKTSLKETYKEDAGMCKLIDSESFRYQEICDFVNYFPVYRTETGYRYRLYYPENDVETTPEGLQPCGCEDVIDITKSCIEPYPFVSSNEYDCCSEALNGFIHFCSIIMEESYAVECISKTAYGPYSFEIINKNRELAYHPQQYKSLQEVKDAIEYTKSCTNDIGMHVLEHILLRPKPNVPCGNIYEYDEGEGRQLITCLLPVCPDTECYIEWQPDIEKDDPCAETDNNPNAIHYIPGSDPYSFWATVVLPSWHKQFRTLEQRQAFEKFLYTQTPALVGLNILWLSPSDLCKFEDAYKKWLAWKEDPAALQCDPNGHHPNCLLSDCIRTLESEPACPTIPGEQGDCDCDDDRREIAFLDTNEYDSSSIFWGYCPPQGIPQEPIGEGVALAEVEARKTVVDEKIEVAVPDKEISVPPVKKKRPATKSAKEVVKKVASSPTKKIPSKKTVSKKTKTKKTPLKKLTKNEALAIIRKRKPKYITNIEKASTAKLKKTKSYERTAFFLENTPTLMAYDGLVSFFDKYSLQKDNNIQDFLMLLKNATWHLLDKLVLDEKENIKKEDIALIKKNLVALKKKGLSLKELDKDWKSEELNTLADSKVLEQVKKLLK